MRVSTLLIVGFSLLIAGCNRHKAEETPLPVTSTAGESAQTKAEQARISGAFYRSVVPKLKDCWGKLQGKGEIEFKLTYRRAGDKWEWQQADVVRSSIATDQPPIALSCLRDAGSGSSFPLESDEAIPALREFSIYWAWPVPFPTDTSELARMIDTGGGGNPECPKTCFNCEGTPGVPGSTKCVASCSGYETCQEDGTGSGCKMTPVGGGRCASGWSGGWEGPKFIARK